MKTIISTPKAPPAVGPYSQAVRTDNLLFCSGQIALRPDGTMVEGDVVEQATQIMSNIKEVLAAAGLTCADIVKTTIFLTDITDFGAVNEVYGQCFESNPPARSTIAVAALPLGAKVEIEVIAHDPK